VKFDESTPGSEGFLLERDYPNRKKKTERILYDITRFGKRGKTNAKFKFWQDRQDAQVFLRAKNSNVPTFFVEIIAPC